MDAQRAGWSSTPVSPEVYQHKAEAQARLLPTLSPYPDTLEKQTTPASCEAGVVNIANSWV
jgi:hypothetical protein